MSAGPVSAVPVLDLPEIGPGDDLGRMLAHRAEIADGSIIAISQKAVSKAESRLVELSDVEPGAEAVRLAKQCEKDPRLVELVLAESRTVMRVRPGVIITETRHGFICANAGIDSSNLTGDEAVALLPLDPDASARRIRAEVGRSRAETGAGNPRIGIVISDSFGRAWRLGQTEVAIGCAGVKPLDDWRGLRDSAGRELAATLIAVADQVAAAADLARSKTSRTPAVVVDGLGRFVTEGDGPGAAALRRPELEDLFR